MPRKDLLHAALQGMTPEQRAHAFLFLIELLRQAGYTRESSKRRRGHRTEYEKWDRWLRQQRRADPL